MKVRLSREWVWAIGIPWVVATLANLFKAFHIDDAGDLEISQWIADHPLHPMQGMLNWSGVNEPIHETNQPHLYYYLIAFWAKLFGWTEVSLHLLHSVSTLAAIAVFFCFVKRLNQNHGIFLTWLFALGPSFVVQQNLKLDIPLIALWLGFFYALSFASDDDEAKARRWYIAACGLCGAAMLVKYNSVILFPILVATPFLVNRKRWLPFAAIPVGVVALWSVFNYWDYGHVHINDRPSKGKGFWRKVDLTYKWIVTLGGLTPFAWYFLAPLRNRWKKGAAIVSGLITVGAVLAVLMLLNREGLDEPIKIYLDRSFFVVGLMMIAVGVWVVVSDYLPQFRQRQGWMPFVLFYWVGASSVFHCLFSPFMAARHVFLTLPALLLVLNGLWQKTAPSRALKASVLALTLFVSAWLAISDYEFADFYRRSAYQLRERFPSEKVWFTGHWGWQWYAKHVGFNQVDVIATQFASGDIVLIPQNLNADAIAQPPAMEKLFEHKQESSWRTFFCTAQNCLLYLSLPGPWTLSHHCQGSIDVYRVR